MLDDSSTLAGLRAVDALKRGDALRLSGDAKVMLYAAEYLDEKNFAALQSLHAKLLLTGARAKSLGIGGAAPLSLEVSSLSYREMMSLADPLAATKQMSVKSRPAHSWEIDCLKLAKQAGLLPALITVDTYDPDSASCALSVKQLHDYITKSVVAVVETARAALPLAGAEYSTVISFREIHSTAVHLALVIGQEIQTPLTRIHSSCVTGDILGSLRCDCGGQLQQALTQLKEFGGILIYLYQEGRSIGITNKLRAYQLQARGMDTYEANLLLGFDEDERDFSIAAAILKALHATKIKLLTNNPHKVEALQQLGIEVVDRLPLIAASSEHNHAYLEAKANKSGHLL